MIPCIANTAEKNVNASEWVGQSPKIVLSVSRCIEYMVPWAHPSQLSKRHLDQFSRFCRAYERYQHTNRPTEKQTTLL